MRLIVFSSMNVNTWKDFTEEVTRRLFYLFICPSAIRSYDLTRRYCWSQRYSYTECGKRSQIREFLGASINKRMETHPNNGQWHINADICRLKFVFKSYLRRRLNTRTSNSCTFHQQSTNKYWTRSRKTVLHRLDLVRNIFCIEKKKGEGDSYLI